MDLNDVAYDATVRNVNVTICPRDNVGDVIVVVENRETKVRGVGRNRDGNAAFRRAYGLYDEEMIRQATKIACDMAARSAVSNFARENGIEDPHG